jgi:hypothetical protein
MSALDDAIARSVNGDDGGSWNPLTPIIIGGSGMNLTTSSSSIQGGVQTAKGGKLVLGNSDWPTFSATRGRTLVFPIVPTMASNSALYGVDCDLSPQYGCLRTLDLNGAALVIPIAKRYLHNGATLTRGTLTWRVGQPHGIVPVPTPKMALWRITTSGGTIVALNSTPQLSVSAATADIYFNKGNAQTLTYNCNQNNVIDTTQYQYALVWTDEAGAIPNNGPPLNLLHSLTLSYSTIADQRFE